VKAAALFLALLAANGRAAPAYVTDELVLGVYAEQSTQGQRLATLHSGASVETLAVSGESTQVRLPDGRTGWVKTAYLTTREPAAVRVKQLQDELDRSRSPTAASTLPAERSDVAHVMPAEPAPAGPAQAQPPQAAAAGGSGLKDGDRRPIAPPPWLWMSSVCIALACGFWLGYAALARRIREKFGGIKVY
jgi:hypothetical protein